MTSEMIQENSMNSNLNILTEVEAEVEAITQANLMLASVRQSVILAAKTGAALLRVKEIKPHGTFQAWVEANMPVNIRQCQKFMKLATEKPELLISKAHPDALLDIDSELKLLAFEDDQQEEIRDVSNELDLTRKQINELTEAVKKGEQSAQEWRQQYLDQRNEARNQAERVQQLERDLQKEKSKPAEVVYVDDSEQALAQYREETQAKIQELKRQAKQAQMDLQEAKRRQQQAIQEGIASQMKARSDEVERLQKQETALAGRIDVLQHQCNEMEDEFFHREALQRFKDNLLDMNASLSALWDDIVPNATATQEWINQIHKAKVMLDQAEQQLPTRERLVSVK